MLKRTWNVILSVSLLGLSELVLAQEAAPAAAPAAQRPDTMTSLLMNAPIILGFFALLYFGVIRPQKQQAAKHAELLAKLGRGDEVVTAGGIIGTIVGMTEKVVTLQIAANTEVKILRSQVQGLFKNLSDGKQA